MTELDKFKRRMIRSAARLLIHEKQDEDQVWAALQKESGCDCKLLWQRMRALTIKKLERLLAADDMPEQLSSVVRLTPIDWLLCDLVLVHEPLDLIGSKHIKKSTEPRPLSKLFELVVHFKIEETEDIRQLADAWTKLTAYYNRSRPKGQRRQASAMLLQRRWYQLKVSTRDAFYKLWHSYRGNAGLWEKVWKPSLLQSAIAKRFPQVITKSFHEWSQLIDAGKVILPKEFEERVRNPPKVTPSTSADSNDPDLVVLEPQIETIDIADSDSDEPNQDQTQQPETIAIQDPDETTGETQDPGENQETVETGEIHEDSNEGMQYEETEFKTEPADGLSNVQILEATHVPEQDFTNDLDPGITIKVEKEDPSDPAVKRRNLSIEMLKYFEATNEVESDTNNDTADDLIKEKTDQFLNTSSGVRNKDYETAVVATPEDVADDLIKEKADAYLSHKRVTEDTVTNTQEEIITESPKDLADENKAESPQEIADEIRAESPEDISDGMAPDDLIKEKTDAFLKRGKTYDVSTEDNSTAGSPLEQRDTEDLEELISNDLIKSKADEYVKKTIKKTLKESPPEAEELISHDLIKSKANEYVRKSVKKTFKKSLPEAEEIISNDLIKSKADEYVRKTIKETFKQSPPEATPSWDEEEFFDDIIKRRANEFVKQADIKKLVTQVAGELPPSVKTSQDTDKVNELAQEAEETCDDMLDLEGMEIVDDGIEYFDEDDDNMDRIGTGQADAGERRETAAFDLKLIMEPVVYTLKLDHMTVFKHTTFNTVVNRDIIEKVFKASKPVSKKAIKDLHNISTGSDQLSQSSEEIRRLDQNISDKDLISQRPFSDLNDKDLVSQKLSIETNRRLDQKLREKKNLSPVLFTELDRKLERNLIDKSIASPHLSAEIQRRLDQQLLEKGVIKLEPNDTDDSEISDDLKVKSSSYLLQKPRSRSYNPIQLCKNPDFNTRLKRLNVGFFTFSRNRQLLKACKPMTIDLHKAFESKLINGTIYLKASQDSDKSIEIDTEEMCSSNVLPSAMPVQSLINNLVEDYSNQNSTPGSTVDLTANKEQQEKKKGTVDLTSDQEKQERNKVINLKDINEIRRINQKLQTAQVTPIRIQESVSMEPVSSPKPDESRVIAGDGKHKANDDQNYSNHPQVDNAQKAQASTSKEIPIVKPHHLKRNTNKEKVRKYTQPNRGPTHVNLKHVKNYNQTTHWNVPVKRNAPKLDEFLITIDTLNKMINKMNGIDEFPYKKVKTIWSVNVEKTKVTYTQKNDDEDEKNDVVKDESSRKDKNSPETYSKTSKDDQSTQAKVPKKKPIIIVKHRKPTQSRGYCCWAKEKLMKTPKGWRVKRLHECDTTCKCCCRHEWADMLVSVYARSTTWEKTELLQWTPMLEGLMPGMLTLNHHQKYAEECRTLEASLEAKAMRLKAQEQLRMMCNTLQVPTERVLIPVPENAPHASEGLSTETVSILGDNEQPPEATCVMDKAGPPAGRRYIAVTSQETSTRIVLRDPPEHFYILAPRNDMLKRTVSTQTLETIDNGAITESVTIEMIPTIERQIGTQKQIVIDGSAATTQICKTLVTSPSGSASKTNVPIVIKTARSSDKIDKMVYLSSKEISKEPSGSPIYLGKNKILLTTVKFPSNLSSKPSVSDPVPPLQSAPTLALPPGVQLVLPPDGQLTYIVEPGVVLTSEQLYTLQLILNNVKNQIVPNSNPSGAEQTPIIATEDVVTVSDDETNPDMEASIAPALASEVAILTEPEVIQPTIEPEVVQAINELEVTQATNSITQAVTESEVDQPTVETDVIRPTTEQEVTNGSQTINEATSTIPEAPILITDVGITDIDKIETDSSTPVTSEPFTNVEPAIVNNEPVNVSMETQETAAATVAPQDANEETSCRNLLMDLMEMSGISAEDTKVTAKEVAPAPVEMVTPIIPVMSDIPVVNLSIPPPTQNLSNLPELSPVTSLAELKYACEQNGKFFKLDFETGVLLPINVCIKKNQKVDRRVKKSPTFYVCTPKSVIDLTDEGDQSSEVENPRKDVSMNYKLPPLAPLSDRPVAKTVNSIIRKVPPPSKLPEKMLGKFRLGSGLFTKARARRILNHTLSRNEKVESEFSGFIRRRRSERKQNLNRIEARIDVVDSDAPFEEEYLLDSESDDDDFRPPPYMRSKIRKELSQTMGEPDPQVVNKTSPRILLKSVRKTIRLPNQDEDSSDDEPLAKKAKKKDGAPSSIVGENSGAAEDYEERLDEVTLNEERLFEETLNEGRLFEETLNEERLFEETLNEERLDDSAVETPTEDPASAGEDEMEIDDTIQPTFLANDEDEDCILGV